MDQLKLVLEHKFWILAGLALILPPIGWWAATDDLAKQTKTRNDKIAETEKKIVNPKDFPNEKWIKGAKEIESELTVSVTQSRERLYDHQKSEMILPPVVRDALARCKVKYRGDGGTSQEFLEAKEFFVHEYGEDWKNAVNQVNPYKMSTGEGLVLLPDEQTQEVTPITRHAEVDQWRQTLVFTSGQMWDVQEDVWFVRSLMKAIARVNQGTTDISNSRIKKVLEVTLRGGDPADLKAREAGTAGDKGPNGAAAKPTGMGFGGGVPTGSSANYKPPKPFDPDDIFGDDGSKANPAETRLKNTSVVSKPYVEQGPKWRKRGFVLKLVMDEREIPTLLSALSESAFPVEIRDVEHAVHNGALDSAWMSNNVAPTANPDGPEFTPEQATQQRKISEGLRMAFNMHYLADVIVAGTLTIYDEPAATASKASTPAAGSAQPAAARATSSPSPAGNARTVTGKAGPAKSVPTGSKSPSRPVGTNSQASPPGAANVPSSTVRPPAAAAKANPPGSKSPPATK